MDTFDKNEGWGIACACNIANGSLVFQARDWNGMSWDKTKFKEGDGVIFDILFKEWGAISAVFDTGSFDTDGYRSFGLFFDDFLKANMWNGRSFLGDNRLIATLTPELNKWYTVAMMINTDGEFFAIMWDPTDETKMLSTREKKGTSWQDLAWTFRLGGAWGSANFDNYRLVTFDGIN